MKTLIKSLWNLFCSFLHDHATVWTLSNFWVWLKRCEFGRSFSAVHEDLLKSTLETWKFFFLGLGLCDTFVVFVDFFPLGALHCKGSVLQSSATVPMIQNKK